MKEVPLESVFMLITGSHGIINRNWRTGVEGKKTRIPEKRQWP